MDGGFHLRLFGPPALLDPDGGVSKFRTRKQLALLVYLTVHRDSLGTSREQLADLLWPGVDEQRGRHSLSQALTVIRNALGRDAVTTVGNHLVLAAPLQTDLDVMSHNGVAEVALNEPLQDFESCAGADFAHWVDAARQRILASARSYLMEALSAARRRGEAKGVSRLAERLYHVDPVNHVAVQALAERALLAGDMDGAGRLLRDHLDRLEAGGDRSNHADLRRLLERIESGAHPTTDILPGPSGTTPAAATVVFVGRARELAGLESQWEQALAGTFRPCLVSGVAGVGKTALVRQFATSLAARGNLVLVVRCEEIAKGVPFAALSDLIGELSKDPALGGTDPHWLAEASRIAPALKAKYPGLPTPDQAPGESVRLRVAEAMYRMVETVADGSPIFIGIDDIQHLDQASRDVLHILARRLSEHRAMLLGAERIEGFDSATFSQRPTTDLGPWQAKLELAPLPIEEARALITELTSNLDAEPDGVRIRGRIAKLADGNPYLIEMLISDWHAHGGDSLAAAGEDRRLTGTKWRPPDTLRLIFSRHYGGLRTKGRQIFELLAVAGRAMDAAELGRLLGIAAETARQFVREIIERGVLRVEGDAVSFKNELHRAFVYYAMPDESRRYHHASLARALVADARDGQSTRYVEAAHHFVEAGMAQDAIGAAVTGAEDAVRHGAPREAERALRDALRTVRAPSNKALLLLAESLNQQGLYSEATRILEPIDAAQASDSDLAKRASLYAEGMVRGRLADDNTITTWVHKALHTCHQLNSTIETARALQTAAELSADAGDWEGFLDAECRADQLSKSATDEETSAYTELTKGFCSLARGRFADGYWRLTNSAAVFERVRHVDLLRALNGRAICAWGVGEFGLALDVFDRGLFYAERMGDYGAACNIAANVAALMIDLAEKDAATRLVERAFDYDARLSDNRYSSKLYSMRALLDMWSGDFQAAARHLQQSELEARRTELPFYIALSLFFWADYHLATRMPEEALNVIAQAEAVLERSNGLMAGTQGNVCRLIAYRHWRLADGEAGKRLLARQAAHLPITAMVELHASREWMTELSGGPPPTRPNARDLIAATGLEGLRTQLELVGMFPTGAAANERTSSAAIQ